MSAIVQARLDEDSQQALKQLANRLGLTPSQIVREGIRLMMEQYTPAPRPKIIGVGKFKSNIPDLGSNKKHIEGFGK